MKLSQFSSMLLLFKIGLLVFIFENVALKRYSNSVYALNHSKDTYFDYVKHLSKGCKALMSKPEYIKTEQNYTLDCYKEKISESLKNKSNKIHNVSCLWKNKKYFKLCQDNKGNFCKVKMKQQHKLHKYNLSFYKCLAKSCDENDLEHMKKIYLQSLNLDTHNFNNSYEMDCKNIKYKVGNNSVKTYKNVSGKPQHTHPSHTHAPHKHSPKIPPKHKKIPPKHNNKSAKPLPNHNKSHQGEPIPNKKHYPHKSSNTTLPTPTRNHSGHYRLGELTSYYKNVIAFLSVFFSFLVLMLIGIIVYLCKKLRHYQKPSQSNRDSNNIRLEMPNAGDYSQIMGEDNRESHKYHKMKNTSKKKGKPEKEGLL